MGPRAAGDDELPSLLRRSHLGSIYDHDIRFENRNAEDVHKDALAAALAEHERVREIALRAYELNELREEQERLRQHALQEEERVRIETERAKGGVQTTGYREQKETDTSPCTQGQDTASSSCSLTPSTGLSNLEASGCYPPTSSRCADISAPTTYNSTESYESC